MWLELSKIHIDTFIFWWSENVGWKVQVVKIIFYTLDIFSSFVGWLENVFVVKIVFWTFDSFVFTLEEKSYTLEICLSTRLNFLHAWTLKIAWTLLKSGCVALLLGWAALPSVQLHLNPETEFGFFLERKKTQELGRQFLVGKEDNNRTGQIISCWKELMQELVDCWKVQPSLFTFSPLMMGDFPNHCSTAIKNNKKTLIIPTFTKV